MILGLDWWEKRTPDFRKNATVKVGDTVWWRGSWGTEEALLAQVDGLQLDGDEMEEIYWSDIMGNSRDDVVVVLKNGHWAYGKQISPYEEKTPPKIKRRSRSWKGVVRNPNFLPPKGQWVQPDRDLKRDESCWPVTFGYGEHYKVLDYDWVENEKVLVLKTGPREDNYEIVYVDEVKF